MDRAVFRADASAQMGTGHIMRCLSLAQHWQKANRRLVLASCFLTSYLEERLAADGLETIRLASTPGSSGDIKQTLDLASQISASWVVLDGYSFNDSFQRAIKDSGLNLLVLDDLGCTNHYYADIIVNQNIYAEENLYTRREPYTRLMLGTTYALLRKEFSKWQRWKRQIPLRAKNVLVTLGGSDPDNITEKAVYAIRQIGLENLHAIVIAAHHSLNEEEKSVGRGDAGIIVKENVRNISKLMAWADVAISAGGTTTWELAYMGLPMLTIAIADNQRQTVEGLSRTGASINLGWHRNVTSSQIAGELSKLMDDPRRRHEMSLCARNLVDGKGAKRVLAEIESVQS